MKHEKNIWNAKFMNGNEWFFFRHAQEMNVLPNSLNSVKIPEYSHLKVTISQLINSTFFEMFDIFDILWNLPVRFLQFLQQFHLVHRDDRRQAVVVVPQLHLLLHLHLLALLLPFPAGALKCWAFQPLHIIPLVIICFWKEKKYKLCQQYSTQESFREWICAIGEMDQWSFAFNPDWITAAHRFIISSKSNDILSSYCFVITYHHISHHHHLTIWFEFWRELPIGL